jgi:hypothetical protein
MGKTSRARKHIKKMQEKRKAKIAKRALYASMRGTSKKRKKIERRPRYNQFNPKKHKHLMEKCGNPGCRKCGVYRAGVKGLTS